MTEQVRSVGEELGYQSWKLLVPYLAWLGMGSLIIRLHAVPLWLLPPGSPQIVQFVVAWVFPVCAALLLHRFPESLARRMLMPDQDHHLR